MMPLVYILLIVFAIFSVFSRNLKRAIIGSCVFSLWLSVAYVLYQAPDVALAEAIVSACLTTILFIITIKNYDDISVRPSTIVGKNSSIFYIFIFVVGALVLYLTHMTERTALTPLTIRVMESYLAHDTEFNPVANIYLKYRVFDTIFEALMLLISGLGVVHLIKYPGSMFSKKHDKIQSEQNDADGNQSIPAEDPWHEMCDFGASNKYCHYHQKTLAKNEQTGKSITLKNKKHPSAVLTITFLMPIILLVGIYLTISHPLTPGGGFQGGALLAGVFVSHYLLMPDHPVKTKFLESFEKIIFLLFVALVILYILSGLHQEFPYHYHDYFLLADILLGVKVFFGLSIMFIYFAREHNKVWYDKKQ